MSENRPKKRPEGAYRPMTMRPDSGTNYDKPEMNQQQKRQAVIDRLSVRGKLRDMIVRYAIKTLEKKRSRNPNNFDRNDTEELKRLYKLLDGKLTAKDLGY
jgi:hypothetical protein